MTLSGLQRSVRRASIFPRLCNTPVSISGQGGVQGYMGLVKDQSHAALGAMLAAELSPRGRLSMQKADKSTTSTLSAASPCVPISAAVPSAADRILCPHLPHQCIYTVSAVQPALFLVTCTDRNA